MLQHLQWLLRRVLRILDSLVAHADGSLNEVVHLVLLAEVPGVTFVPHAGNQLAAVQEASPTNLRCWVYFVPDHELKRVENWVKGFMPLPEQVVASEHKNVAGWLKYPLKGFEPFGWTELFVVPLSQVVVDVCSPAEFHIAGRVAAQVIRRICQNQIDRLIGYVIQPISRSDLPLLRQVQADIFRFQLLIGCRLGELVKLQPAIANRSGDVWFAELAKYRTFFAGGTTVGIYGETNDVVRVCIRSVWNRIRSRREMFQDP